MNSTLKSMLIAAAAITSVSAYAQDKATLDLLVKKGVITAEDRAKTLEEAAAARTASGIGRVFPKEDTTSRLTFSGYFQTQFENFSYSETLGSAHTAATQLTGARAQSAFLIRRLYLETMADLGNGISGNVVFDMSGNTANSIDRAMVSLAGSYGSFDFGYRKVTWGYEESTLSSLFKASSSKLYTVERGITNRYWNEQENGTSAAGRSDGRRLGFGAHHLGLHYNSVTNTNGLEYGASVTNSSQGFNNFKGYNDLGVYANVVWNNKISDSEKYAVGVNYGKASYFNGTTVAPAFAKIEGYNPFVQAQYFAWTVLAEYMSTKVGQDLDAANTNNKAHTPKGYDITVAYDFSQNWQGVFRYTNLDSDFRGQQIGDGERDFASVGGLGATTFNKSESYYLGLNYFFTLNALGKEVAGTNAKIQLGYEMATFKDTITSAGVYGATTANGFGDRAKVNTIRLQAQVAF
jgi:hypothetical protein